MTQSFSFRYQPVLGTELQVLVACETATSAKQAQQRVLGELLRLEAMLSTYRPDTPLSRWMRAEEPGDLPGEVVAVLELAQDWYVTSKGALHPGLGRLRARWREAERDGRPPNREECRRLVAQADQLPYTVRTSEGVRSAHRIGDCTDLDLDALAKGWIVDRAAEIGMSPEVEWLMVNVGGDLRLVGSGSVRVAIEDPASRIDNAPPLAVVTLTPGGLASSGPARRGFQVAGQWFGHVLDPRTGWPAEGVAGVTVIAADTITADALATVVEVDGIQHPTVTALLNETQAAVLSVSAAGAVELSPRWREQVSFELPANS